MVKVEALRDEVSRVLDPERAQVRDTADLRVDQIVRVIHDSLQIRFAEADTLAMGEREIHDPPQVSRSTRGLLSAGTAVAASRAWS